MLVLTMYGRVALVEIQQPNHGSRYDSTVQSIPHSLHMLPTKLQEEAQRLAENFAEQLGFESTGQWGPDGSKSVMPIRIRQEENHEVIDTETRVDPINTTDTAEEVSELTE